MSTSSVTKEYCLGFLGMGFVLLLDYFTYSATFFYSGSISLSFFLIAVIIFKRFSKEISV